MKALLFLCVLALAALAAGDEASQTTQTTHNRGCIYILGKCERECEEGTHAYALGCGHKTPEATCEDPHPQPEQGQLCDYSACYCDPPTLRDTHSGKCVQPEDCPGGRDPHQPDRYYSPRI